MCKIQPMSTPTQKKAAASIKSYQRPSSASEHHKKHLSPVKSNCQRSSSFNDIRSRSPSLKPSPAHNHHIAPVSPERATAISGCVCKDKLATMNGLRGNNLQPFYKVWTMKDAGKHAVKNRVLDPPAAWKRSDQYRSCGCATRSHLSSLGLQSVHQCRCGKVSMTPN